MNRKIKQTATSTGTDIMADYWSIVASIVSIEDDLILEFRT